MSVATFTPSGQALVSPVIVILFGESASFRMAYGCEHSSLAVVVCQEEWLAWTYSALELCACVHIAEHKGNRSILRCGRFRQSGRICGNEHWAVFKEYMKGVYVFEFRKQFFAFFCQGYGAKPLASGGMVKVKDLGSVHPKAGIVRSVA